MTECLKEARSFSIALAGLLILAAPLGAFLAVWLQERCRVRREHRDAIKARILDPLRREFEEFYLPLLKGQLGPVVLEDGNTLLRGSNAQGQGTGRRLITLRRAFGHQPSSLRAEFVLYADAKRRHYRRFFRMLDVLTYDVRTYTSAWLPYAEQVSQAIRERVGLRAVAETPVGPDTDWIDPDGLAVFVVNRQLGIAQQPPVLGRGGLSVEIGGVTMAQGRTEDPIQRVLKVLEELSGERERAQELLEQCEHSLPVAKFLFRELEELRISSRLPGRCRFARV
jgi:hypothetical protein